MSIESDIEAIAEPTASIEDIAGLMGRIDAAVRRAKEAQAAFKEAFVRHLQATGPMTIGDVTYRAGHRKEAKCLSNDAAADAVYTAVAGDMSQFTACLSSSAFLPGACRKVLAADVFDSLFETVEKPVLVEGKAKPQLLEFNERYSR